MQQTQIEPIYSPQEKLKKLTAEFEKARHALMEAEAELAEEQAAVNAFRMHCRLELDNLVDTLLELKAKKEACLTRLALLQQGFDPDKLDEEDDPLAEIGPEIEEISEEEELLLPTPTPGDKAAEKRLYRELARRFHPDLAVTAVERSYRTSMMSAVNLAYSSGDVRALYDLAVELEPDEILELSGIDDIEIRRLRELIMKARHQRRKARRQLLLLRKENTYRLWAKAQLYEEKNADWWSLVKRELEEVVDKRQDVISELSSQIDHLEAIRSQDSDESASDF